MPQRAGGWLKQALRDLEQAKDSAQWGRHEWACFAAQQAAEKAVRALHLHSGYIYVPSRYPNGHPEGAPFEHYGPLQSKMAVNYASEIIEFVRFKMA
ncbi:MAG: HEPN domain-containing protein [Caldiserica bacterium]|jgi:HEPN domain-containing protein|nr:HEPN domain-containing protein [Caldisericota bacterium]